MTKNARVHNKYVARVFCVVDAEINAVSRRSDAANVGRSGTRDVEHFDTLASAKLVSNEQSFSNFVDRDVIAMSNDRKRRAVQKFPVLSELIEIIDGGSAVATTYTFPSASASIPLG